MEGGVAGWSRDGVWVGVIHLVCHQCRVSKSEVDSLPRQKWLRSLSTQTRAISISKPCTDCNSPARPAPPRSLPSIQLPPHRPHQFPRLANTAPLLPPSPPPEYRRDRSEERTSRPSSLAQRTMARTATSRPSRSTNSQTCSLATPDFSRTRTYLCPPLHRRSTVLTRFGSGSETFSSLPGGDSRLRLQQSRIASRLQELRDVSSLQGNLEGTHLRDRVKREDGQEVKKEDDAEADEGEGEMEDVEKTGVADEASSPVAKRRIAAAQLVRFSFLPSSLSVFPFSCRLPVRLQFPFPQPATPTVHLPAHPLPRRLAGAAARRRQSGSRSRDKEAGEDAD